MTDGFHFAACCPKCGGELLTVRLMDKAQSERFESACLAEGARVIGGVIACAAQRRLAQRPHLLTCIEVAAELTQQGRQIEHPDPWLEDGTPWEFPRADIAWPVRFGGCQLPTLRDAPHVGQHSDELLRELGLPPT